MDAAGAQYILDQCVAALAMIHNFGKSEAGQPANAPWLTGTALEYVDEALGALGGAKDMIEAAEETEIGVLEPGTGFRPPEPGAML